MNLVETSEQMDKEKAKTIVDSVPLIPEVEGIDVELYTDNTGDPSLQLTFRLRSGTDVDDDFLDRFNSFAATVQTKILHSDIHRFPYTRMEEAA